MITREELVEIIEMKDKTIEDLQGIIDDLEQDCARYQTQVDELLSTIEASNEIILEASNELREHL